MASKKLLVFQIQLIDNRLVFYSGEKLEGKVVLQLSKHMEMECLKISCRGKVKTEWEDYITVDDTPQTQKFKSNENLITEERKLFGMYIYISIDKSLYSFLLKVVQLFIHIYG